jgi:uncharacterized SAM-binding protein YcdF (DUF218 family)
MMFVLKKLLTPFLLPPGIIVMLLGVFGTRLAMRRRWRSGWIFFSLGLLLWALSTAPLADGLMRKLEAGISIPANPTGDVIVLLGGGIIDDVPDLSGTAAPTPLMMGRLVAAVRLYRRLHLPIVVSGGRWFNNGKPTEASVDKRILIDLGVPGDKVIEEDRARDTMQNARFSAAICRRHGFSKPILLTAAYHLKRACMAFDAAGVKVIPFPAYFLGSTDAPLVWYNLLPRAGALDICAIALHEYLGILYSRMI